MQRFAHSQEDDLIPAQAFLCLHVFLVPVCVFSTYTSYLPQLKCLRLTEEPKWPQSVCLCVFVIDCDLSVVSSLTETTGPLRLFCFFNRTMWPTLHAWVYPFTFNNWCQQWPHTWFGTGNLPAGPAMWQHNHQPSRRGSSNRTHSPVKKRTGQAVEFSLFILVRDNKKRASFSEHSPNCCAFGFTCILLYLCSWYFCLKAAQLGQYGSFILVLSWNSS